MACLPVWTLFKQHECTLHSDSIQAKLQQKWIRSLLNRGSPSQQLWVYFPSSGVKLGTSIDLSV